MVGSSCKSGYLGQSLLQCQCPGLKATSPTKKDGRDGQISGTTDKMEYATNSGFTNAKDCVSPSVGIVTVNCAFGFTPAAQLAVGTEIVKL